MKKIIIKIVLILNIIIILISNINIYAVSDPLEDPNSWQPTISEETEIFEKAGIILGVINVIGVVCSVIVLTIFGIKYMLGSVEEKAEYKSMMWIYILGMFLLFAATTIPNIVYNLMTENF